MKARLLLFPALAVMALACDDPTDPGEGWHDVWGTYAGTLVASTRITGRADQWWSICEGESSFTITSAGALRLRGTWTVGENVYHAPRDYPILPCDTFPADGVLAGTRPLEGLLRIRLVGDSIASDAISWTALVTTDSLKIFGTHTTGDGDFHLNFRGARQ